MASQGELDVIHVNGEALYRECSDQHHHHHIVCHECGRTIEIEIPGLEQWIDKAAKQLKYQTIAHELEIFDLCAPSVRRSMPSNRLSASVPHQRMDH